MNLNPRLAGGGEVTPTEHGWALSIPAGPASRYRLAQLDDHLHIPRKRYPWRAPMRMQLEARVSAAALPGTWGFGLWNDPYGFSFGPGDGFLRLPALPNAAWFFHSSPISYLSLRDDTPGNGFLAQTFSSPRFHPLLFRAALAAPFSLKTTRRLLSRVIAEESVSLSVGASPGAGDQLRIDSPQWHRYDLEWTSAGTRFLLDNTRVLDTPLSPRAPMGLVIWIDNQHAGLDPHGSLTYGFEINPTRAWLEIRNVHAE